MINPVLITIVAIGIIAVLVFVTFRITRMRNQKTVKRENNHISILPKTTPGKWSVGLAIAFIIAFVVFIALIEIPTGFSGPSPTINLDAYFILVIVIVAISAATVITGLLSIIKNKERSVLVIIGIVITFWFGLIGATGQFLI